MSVVVHLAGGAASIVDADPEWTVGALLRAIHGTLALPQDVECYDVVHVAADGDEADLGAMEPRTTLVDAGVPCCEDAIDLRLKFQHVAMEKLRARGVHTAADAEAAAIRALACERPAAAPEHEAHATTPGPMGGGGDILRLIHASRILPPEAAVFERLLYDAVERGDVECVRRVLALGGVDVDYQRASDERAALHAACEGGVTDAVRVLLDHGASCEVPSEYEERPLCLAAAAGHLQTVATLLARGAAVDALEDIGRTPLWYAACRGHAAVATALVAAGAAVDTADDDGCTPLWTAACSGEDAIVAYLLDSGAAIDCTDNTGHTPMHSAACRGKHTTVELLLARGAAVNAADVCGNTPLCEAASNGHADAVRVLLAHRAAVDLADECGRTPLARASANNHTHVADILIEHGAARVPAPADA